MSNKFMFRDAGALDSPELEDLSNESNGKRKSKVESPKKAAEDEAENVEASLSPMARKAIGNTMDLQVSQ